MSKLTDLTDKYVIVRCRDAGVHAGEIVSYQGRECVLRNSRRLWYWYPKEGKWLDAVALTGLRKESRLGPTNPGMKVLTENCEIIECSQIGEHSIRNHPDD